MATLITYSGTNLYTAGAGVTITAQAVHAEQLPQWRAISTSRWNKPQLMTSTANFPRLNGFS